jgi:hypothetical protein
MLVQGHVVLLLSAWRQRAKLDLTARQRWAGPLEGAHYSGFLFPRKRLFAA